MAKYSVILPAAGKSSRFNDQNYKKPFIQIDNKAVWLHAAEKFLNRADVIQTIVVISEEDRDFFEMKFGASIAMLGFEIVLGGARRSDSVQAALEKVREEADYVAIHDAARPCIADAWISKVFAAAEVSGAAMLAVPVVGTLKRSNDGRSIDETVSRERLWEAQTPQVFRRDLIMKAYAQRDGLDASDDAQLVERMGEKVTLVTGSRLNLKITTREDIKLAAAGIKGLPKPKLAGGGGNPLDDMWR